ncbi:hypothetical protein M3912_003124 [Vibrio metschnikovii]|nr:hypothetical protein [Vibrio metschnikovii]
MKLEKAYSLDLKISISPEKADIKYQEGLIFSKYRFQCPDESCDAQVTCANLNKPKKLRKRDPYYVAVEEHSKDCAIGKVIIEQTKGGGGDSPYGTDKPIEGAVRLNITAPSVTKPKTVDGNGGGGTIDGNGPGRGRGKPTGDEREITASKNVSSLVDAFLNNDEFDIELPVQESISIKDFFIKVNEQNIDDFVDEYRIYYGKAWFNKRQGGDGFIVRFANKLSAGDINKQPTFFITSEIIEKCNLKKFKAEHLGRLCDSKPRQVYILTSVAPVVSKSGYINFHLEALHFMDQR